jgi:hypothetical protein
MPQVFCFVQRETMKRLEKEMASISEVVQRVDCYASHARLIPLPSTLEDLPFGFQDQLAGWEDSFEGVRFLMSWTEQILRFAAREMMGAFMKELASWTDSLGDFQYLMSWSEHVLRFVARELMDAFMKELASWKDTVSGVRWLSKQLWHVLRNGRFARFPISFDDLPTTIKPIFHLTEQSGSVTRNMILGRLVFLRTQIQDSPSFSAESIIHWSKQTASSICQIVLARVNAVHEQLPCFACWIH